VSHHAFAQNHKMAHHTRNHFLRPSLLSDLLDPNAT